MSAKVDLYNNAYSNHAVEVYRQVRLETYGEDFGQTSWVTTKESYEIPRLLALTPDSNVLEIGCGSGTYALHIAKTTNCHMVAVDVNKSAITNANQLAAAENLKDRIQFEHCDASKPLPFAEARFSAAFLNDVICHLPNRDALLRELFRVLEPGGKLLFSDALVIGGTISHQEIAARSSIGYYIFSPPGENERLLERIGFSVLEVRDTSGNAAEIAQRWKDARTARKDQLIQIEGERNFDGLQQFLDCVHILTSERRLLRHVYLAQKK